MPIYGSFAAQPATTMPMTMFTPTPAPIPSSSMSASLLVKLPAAATLRIDNQDMAHVVILFDVRAGSVSDGWLDLVM